MASAPFGPMPDGSNLASMFQQANSSGFMDMLSLTSPQGAAIKLGSEALGAILGKPISSSASSPGVMDGSGWNVNFGDGSITSSASKPSAMNWMSIGIGVVFLIVAVKMWRK